MSKNVFEVFMAEHPPALAAVHAANEALWDGSCLDPVLKERMRIVGADAIGCSYCARFRTESGGRPILADDGPRDDEFETRVGLAEQLMVGAIERRNLDGLIEELQDAFTPGELSDLVFSVGWFIGMQHVGRFMHWDESCPVAPIRELVAQGLAH